MNRISLIAVMALAIVTSVPAEAEKSDRIMVETIRSRIMAIRTELPATGAGAVELAEAESRLRDLSKALDDNEASDARASLNGIEALIAAARVRANATALNKQTTPLKLAPAQALSTRKRIAYRPAAKSKCACRLASR